MPVSILNQNIMWCVRLRWMIIGFFVALGVAALARTSLERFGILLSPGWPLCLAAVLAVSNLFYRWLARRPAASQSRALAHTNLCLQILLDLLVLTVVVHRSGGLGTYAPFAYVGHIALACIFLSRRASVIVILLASSLFTGVVLSHMAGILPHHSIFVRSSSMGCESLPAAAVAAQICCAIAVWCSVWYLSSHMSSLLRKRTALLRNANQLLVTAGEERARHMLRKTHELKAPFAAINANTQLLLKGYCGELPDAARDVVTRIDARCRRLSEEIKQMLQLANLQSRAQEEPILEPVDLAKTVNWVLGQVQDIARANGVAIETELVPVTVRSVLGHTRMLLENLVANAIVYSRRGGRVRVSCGPAADAAAVLVIADDGIGIPAEKVPHIFEDYYRTEEAVAHNKSSSGLGLAIVRRIAQRHRLTITVETIIDRGTVFTIRFPPDATEKT